MAAFRIFLILVLILMPTHVTFACSWAPPSGPMSAWVEDKTVFWGRPLRSKWDTSVDSSSPSFAYATYTTIEVIEPIKGNLPRTIKVYHPTNASACGIFFHLGEIQLIVLPGSHKKSFYTDESIHMAVNNIVLFSYLTDGVDVRLDEIRPHIYKLFDFDDSCSDEKQTVSDYCKWEEDFYDATEKYQTKIEKLSQKNNKVSWWRNFWRQKD